MSENQPLPAIHSNVTSLEEVDERTVLLEERNTDRPMRVCGKPKWSKSFVSDISTSSGEMKAGAIPSTEPPVGNSLVERAKETVPEELKEMTNIVDLKSNHLCKTAAVVNVIQQRSERHLEQQESVPEQSTSSFMLQQTFTESKKGRPMRMCGYPKWLDSFVSDISTSSGEMNEDAIPSTEPLVSNSLVERAKETVPDELKEIMNMTDLKANHLCKTAAVVNVIEQRSERHLEQQESVPEQSTSSLMAHQSFAETTFESNEGRPTRMCGKPKWLESFVSDISTSSGEMNVGATPSIEPLIGISLEESVEGEVPEETKEKKMDKMNVNFKRRKGVVHSINTKMKRVP